MGSDYSCCVKPDGCVPLLFVVERIRIRSEILSTLLIDNVRSDGSTNMNQEAAFGRSLSRRIPLITLHYDHGKGLQELVL